MNKLWAPWRSKYIYLRKNKSCIFCIDNKDADKDKKRYILSRTEYSFSMLNLYPYNNAHVMIAPYRHTKSIGGLSSAEVLDLMSLLKRTKMILDKKLKPDGYNIGMNIGKVAGAGFAGHLHMHIVPRWAGDTNFMPIIADTKIVSESLDAMYKLLREKC